MHPGRLSGAKLGLVCTSTSNHDGCSAASYRVIEQRREKEKGETEWQQMQPYIPTAYSSDRKVLTAIISSAKSGNYGPLFDGVQVGSFCVGDVLRLFASWCFQVVLMIKRVLVRRNIKPWCLSKAAQGCSRRPRLIFSQSPSILIPILYHPVFSDDRRNQDLKPQLGATSLKHSRGASMTQLIHYQCVCRND